MTDSIGVTVLLYFIKSIVFIYDVITYPLYFIIQKPWIVIRKSSQIFAKQLTPDDPSSPLVCVKQPEVEYWFDCNTIPEFFSRIVQKFGDKKCFGQRQLISEEEELQPNGKIFRKVVMGHYQWFSYNQVDERIENIAKGLLVNGVNPQDNVIIFAETRLEWMISAQAILRIGAVVATLYATLGEDGIVHGINETQAKYVITTNILMFKLEKHKDKLPFLRCIVYMEGFKPPQINGFGSQIKIISFSQLEKQGKDADIHYEKVEANMKNNTTILMYTSGSTGTPKAVNITHQNLLATAKAYSLYKEMFRKDDIYIGYLPLAHSYELAVELLIMSYGISIGYGHPLTLTNKSPGIKEGSEGDVVALKPNVIVAVPLVLDNIRKGINEQLKQRGKLFHEIFNFAIDYKTKWRQRGFQTPIVNRLVCNKIKPILGGQLKTLIVGAAPLSAPTQNFIASCFDTLLLQGYGLTETMASTTCMDPSEIATERIGPPLHGIQIKLIDWEEGGYRPSDKPNPRGEIVVGGDNVTAGYYKNPELTRESYYEDKNGVRWFKTGDIGEFYPNGSIKLIDRKKDLIKLQFGEFISLSKVESELKSCNFVDNICVYGNPMGEYVIALVIPNAKALKILADQFGKENKSFKELCDDYLITQEVKKAIQQHGEQVQLSKREIPAKIKLCSDEWIPDSGLVTAALKLRRKNVQEFYNDEIKRLYESK